MPFRSDLALVVVTKLILVAVIECYTPILTFPLLGGRDASRRGTRLLAEVPRTDVGIIALAARLAVASVREYIDIALHART